jgi:hypothetical protein
MPRLVHCERRVERCHLGYFVDKKFALRIVDAWSEGLPTKAGYLSGENQNEGNKQNSSQFSLKKRRCRIYT